MEGLDGAGGVGLSELLDLCVDGFPSPLEHAAPDVFTPAGAARRQKFYDTFDGRLYGEGVTLRHKEGRLTLLAYGTRDPNDITHYPRSGKISFRGVGVIGPGMPLRVAGCEAALGRLNPDLQKVQLFRLRWIKFAVTDSTARRHQLKFPRRQSRHITCAIFVGDFAVEYVADNFHIAMAVGIKTGICCNMIVINHPQCRKSHLAFIVIIAE